MKSELNKIARVSFVLIAFFQDGPIGAAAAVKF